MSPTDAIVSLVAQYPDLKSLLVPNPQKFLRLAHKEMRVQWGDGEFDARIRPAFASKWKKLTPALRQKVMEAAETLHAHSFLDEAYRETLTDIM